MSKRNDAQRSLDKRNKRTRETGEIRREYWALPEDHAALKTKELALRKKAQQDRPVSTPKCEAVRFSQDQKRCERCDVLLDLGDECTDVQRPTPLLVRSADVASN